MSGVKSLWASVQGDPVFMRRVNGWFTIFWILMIPVSAVAGWLHSVMFVSALSLWALVSGHWSAWQAARVEVTQQAEAEKAEVHPIEERVVDELVERTSIEPITAVSPRRMDIRRHADALAEQLEALQQAISDGTEPADPPTRDPVTAFHSAHSVSL